MDNQEIKVWLKLHNKSQKWLSTVLNVDVTTTSRWLNDPEKMPQYLRDNFEDIMKKAIAEEARRERDKAHLERYLVNKQEEETQLKAVSISDADLYQAAGAVNMTPQELIRRIYIRKAIEDAQSTANAIK